MKPSDGKKPHLVITVGIPGSGKSFFAEHFAKTFSAPIISLDHFKIQMFNDEVIDDQQTDRLNTLVFSVLDEVLKTKQTAIYEGHTNLRSERSTIAKKARDAGYEPLFVWTQTDQTTAKKRLINKKGNKIDKHQFDLEIKRFSPPHLLEKAIVISGKHTYNSQLKIILSHLAKNNGPPTQTHKPINRKILIR